MVRFFRLPSDTALCTLPAVLRLFLLGSYRDNRPTGCFIAVALCVFIHPCPPRKWWLQLFSWNVFPFSDIIEHFPGRGTAPFSILLKSQLVDLISHTFWRYFYHQQCQSSHVLRIPIVLMNPKYTSCFLHL